MWPEERENKNTIHYYSICINSDRPVINQMSREQKWMCYMYIIHTVSSANVLNEGCKVVSALIYFGSNNNERLA